MRQPTTYFILSFDPERAPAGMAPPPLPELVPTIVYALATVRGLGLPTAWFRLSQWQAWTLDEADDEHVGSCALDEAEEGGYQSLDF
jgi:hypothetical protein